jgi:hypothetical protein
MKRTNRYLLSSQIVKPYFVDHISTQSAISDLCINQLNLEKGQYFVDLPEFCHTNRLYKFDCGGMLPDRDTGAEPVQNAFGKEYTPRFFVSTEPETCYFILQFLNLSDSHYALFHDNDVLPTDKYAEIKNVKTVTNGQEVYHVLNKRNNSDDIKNTFNCCCSPRYTIVVLGSGRLKNSLNFIRDNESIISSNLDYIIASAYDGEAYIVWQNNDIN